MTIYPHGNWRHNTVCPICGTAADTPVTLVAIAGTEQGNIVKAHQYHVKCLELHEYIGPSDDLSTCIIATVPFIPKEPTE